MLALDRFVDGVEQAGPTALRPAVWKQTKRIQVRAGTLILL
jgi:hypothetical protein